MSKFAFLFSLLTFVSCVSTPRNKGFQLDDLEGKWLGTWKSFAAFKNGEISAEFKKNSDTKWVLILKNAYLGVSDGVVTINLEEKQKESLSGVFMGGTVELTVIDGKMWFSASQSEFGSVTAKGTITEEELDGTYEFKSERVGDSNGGFNLKRAK